MEDKNHNIGAAVSSTKVIGIDCSTNPANTGVAIGDWCDGHLRVESVQCGDRSGTHLDAIVDALRGADKSLLAIDAPLGWPAAMGDTLVEHRAGDPIDTPPDELFGRLTDRHLHARLGKKPMEVGANWIARTATAALDMLAQIRRQTGRRYPVVADDSRRPRHAVIEVYPGATLKAHALRFEGYKGESRHGERRGLCDAMHEKMELDRLPRELVDLMIESDHALDAVACLLAGKDFLLGEAIGPSPNHIEQARKEGWIWVRHAGRS